MTEQGLPVEHAYGYVFDGAPAYLRPGRCGPGLWSWWTVQNDVVGIFVLLDLDDQLPVVGRGVGNEVASLACLLPNGKPARRGALVLLPKRILPGLPMID